MYVQTKRATRYFLVSGFFLIVLLGTPDNSIAKTIPLGTQIITSWTEDIQPTLLQNKINTIRGLTDLDSLSEILNPVTPVKTVLQTGACPKPPKKRVSIPVSTIDTTLQNVNHTDGYDATFVPNDLVDISYYMKTHKDSTVCVSSPAALALIKMSNDMKKQDLRLTVNSGYRSYDLQKKLHAEYAPIAKTIQFPRVAPPGHSEHQSGLAVDVASELSPGAFASSKESAWIEKHAAEYGFVISYPQNKETQTGYMYEPWHLRYVGTENATLLKEANYTLAFKPTYYTKPFLNVLLNTLKEKFNSPTSPSATLSNSQAIEIGG